MPFVSTETPERQGKRPASVGRLSFYAFDPRFHCCAPKPGDVVEKTARSQKRVESVINSAWRRNSKASQQTAAKALGTARTENQLRNFLGKIDKGLAKQFTQANEKAVRTAIERTYRTAKQIAAKEAGIKGAVSAVDKRRAKKIADSVGRWMDRFYGEHLAQHVENVAFDIFADPGVPLSKRSSAIKKAVNKELRLTGGKSPVGKLRPAPYAGNVGNYSALTSDVASHQARVMAKISAYSDAGLTRYRLRAVIDDRTSPVCIRLNGQVFEIADAEKQIDKMLDAETAEQAKRAQPWKTDEEIQRAIGGARRGSRRAAENLRAAGASVLPPFHGNCRTVPEILGR
jgi:hypothetical protein